MDTDDPFSVWSTPNLPRPSPANTADLAQSDVNALSHTPSTNEPIRLSLDAVDQQDDSGWGAPSAASSPEDTRERNPLDVSTTKTAEDADSAATKADLDAPYMHAESHKDMLPTEASPPGTASADDFDDFDEPAPAGPGGGGGDNDDFGDFDDFDDVPPTTSPGALDDVDEVDAPPPVPTPAPAVPTPTRTWSALSVSRDSSRDSLFASVQDLLPTFTAAAGQMSTDGLRQVEGLAQVLVSEPSRQLWKDLSHLPTLTPTDWIRSRTRRDYLITMGVPVNLDEIHTSSLASSSRLPPLQLKLETRSSSGSAAPGSVPQSGTTSTTARRKSMGGSPRNGTQSPALGQNGNKDRLAERRREELGLGPPPEVDLKRAEEVVCISQDDLSLRSLPALSALLRDLHTLTTSTSSLLTHHLTIRESHTADSEMYNSMIKELVTGAASRIGSNASGGATVSRSASLRGGAAAAGGMAVGRNTKIAVEGVAKRATIGATNGGGAGSFVGTSLRGGSAGAGTGTGAATSVRR